jgi:uncharacterized membrane protein (UPF0127 family)
VIAISMLACGGPPGTATLDVGGHRVLAEVADDPAERALGLMHRDSLDTDAGMLFVYTDSAIREFWMKDTRIPLSIAFIDEAGKVVRVAEMQPFDETRTSSLYPARYALEMTTGWFAAHDVAKGAVVKGLPEPKHAK